jgi:integrase
MDSDGQMLRNLEAFFGPCLLPDISAYRVEAYQQHRVKEVCPATVNREHALLKHMLNLAKRCNLRQGVNPAKLVKFLAEDNLKFQTLSHEQERALLSRCPPYLQDMILFALHTGLRSGDIFNLQWEEVDMQARRLSHIVRKDPAHQSCAAERHGDVGSLGMAGDAQGAIRVLQRHDGRQVPRPEGRVQTRLQGGGNQGGHLAPCGTPLPQGW